MSRSTRSLPPLNAKLLTGPNVYAQHAVWVCDYNDTTLNLSELCKGVAECVRRGKVWVINAEECPETIGKLLHALVINTKKLKEMADSERPGPSTRSLLEECKRRGIPFIRMNSNNLYQLGHGRKRQFIEASCTSNTKAIAEAVVKDKDLTKHVLRVCGLPVPAGYYVESEVELISFYEKLIDTGKGSVVLKPYNGNHGDGVITDIRTREQLLAAYRLIRASHSGQVLLEEFVNGVDYRLLVVNGKMVACAKRVPPSVVGDGRRSIADLIAELNKDPRRGAGHSAMMSNVIYDDVMKYYLQTKGMTDRTVPSAGERVVLRNNGNLSSGGSAEDATRLVHPSTVELAERAARYVDLDVCGLDIVCGDISLPLVAQNGAIIELNSGPGLRMHLQPHSGTSQDVAEPIIRSLFPVENGRIPLIAVTGVNGKTTTVNMIAHALSQLFPSSVIARTNTNGVYVGGKCLEKGDCSGPVSAQTVLIHPDVDMAVLEVARGGIVRKGLGYDRAHVGCVTNIGKGDHLGASFGGATMEDLIRTKAVVLENILPGGTAVLNADDPFFKDLLAYVPADTHISAFSAKDGCLYDQRTGEVLWRSTLEAWSNRFEIENRLASIACLHGLLRNLNDLNGVAQAVSTFQSDHVTNPGRMNKYITPRGTLWVDYAHNEDAVHGVCEMMNTGHRHIAVFGAAGDRSPESVKRMCDELRATFDRVVFFVDHATLRGATAAELLTRMGKNGHQRSSDLYVFGEMEACEKAWEMADSGDNYRVNIVVFADDVDRVTEWAKKINLQ